MKEEYVIQAENLTKRFGNFTAVDHTRSSVFLVQTGRARLQLCECFAD